MVYSNFRAEGALRLTGDRILGSEKSVSDWIYTYIYIYITLLWLFESLEVFDNNGSDPSENFWAM